MTVGADTRKSKNRMGFVSLIVASAVMSSLGRFKPAPVPAKPDGVDDIPILPPPAQPSSPTALPTAGGLVAAPVAHKPGLFGIVRSIIDRFSRDNATLTAAGIAFYLLSSVFPGLAALVSVYGLVGDPSEVGRQIAPFAGLLPPEAMKLLNDSLQGFIKSSANSHVSIALATSLAIALWSARAAMAAIMTGLNIAYEEVDKRSYVVQTLVSLGLTIGVLAFVAVAIFSIAVVPALLALFYLGETLQALLEYGRWPLLASVVVFGFAVLYRYAPYRSHPRWRWITWGSGIATVLWLSGSILFSFYVRHFGSYDATYGSLGAVIILLLWFWFGALVMILGAEIDSELDVRATLGGAPTAGTPPSAGPPRKG
ncbi:YihY/virulence factor BrkB family protein [Lichenihabitans sp. Uapishka_5]|uniref:YihY/virulence factor BrkB family protein n=1 Tax=Lichenihabitans sp. Uapishka_5 TaxID=3037302 RepID=UPI0029E7D09F|nr:YihY/virulence factor BrkB family protein [Lichenihabitans sp. Uapishka_5]MDX7953174.1 YihY/virulence factor BrkB family protein [Lichenihabitans sp. Uapishka_5]